MTSPDMEQRVAAVRRFSRFYTRQLGCLQDMFLQTPFSLAEARVLYELAHRDKPTATAIADELGLDRAYLSRILRGFADRDLIFKTPSRQDGRQVLLSLTTKGRLAFASIDERSQGDVAGMLEKIPVPAQERVVGAMGAIERLIGGQADEPDAARPAYVLRPPRAGDMGWIVARHGALYAQEHGWGQRFEGLCAEIVAEFCRDNDPARERCWIADIDGEPVGCVFLVRASDEVAKLRLILVEPRARGLGIGSRLVEECIGFARAAGYKTMTLWTQSVLVSARRIYEAAGFRCVASEAHAEFGVALTGETWERAL
jgi:DNA-binding MarR family transcriptional regulator/N-acetylglutamate synthase-like GNAT family acetyltransferase